MKLITLSLIVAIAGGCGDNIAAAPDAAIPDGPPAFAEATHSAPPTVINGGGAVLATPTVIPIFFTAEDSQTDIETYLGQLAASPYWGTTTSEYGVGALTIAPSVLSSDTPPTTDADLQTWLTTAYPTPDANTIYAVFLPNGVVLDEGGGNLSCKAFGGYHDETDAGLVYALLPRCAANTLGSVMDNVTVATSHEIIEASTDPHPFSAPAFVTIDPAHYVWSRTPGAELGDMCEYVEAAPQRIVGTYMVQRTWSNASAAAGHDPCVPVLATAYAGAAPVLPDMTISTHGGMMLMTQGATVALGTSQTIEVDLFSDAPSDDYTVEAYDAAELLGTGQVDLAFQWDRQTGHNGDKLNLMITRTKAAAGSRGNEFVIQTKVSGVVVAMWWGLVE